MSRSLNAPVSGTAIADYYDKDIARCLRDFVYGNARISAAVNRVCSQMSDDVQTILDVGCGAGIAAAAYREANPRVHIHGVDISPQRIEIATALVGDERATFAVHDMSSVPHGAPYDLIAMIDVYEHIPLSGRSEFHQALADSLSPDGVVVLTTPSELHQEYLATHKSEGLQVVDETITIDDMVLLAKALGGTIVTYEMVSIWNSHDYVHTVIKKRPKYAPVDKVRSPRASLFKRVIRRHERRRREDAIRERRELVRQKLGIQVDI